MYDTLRPELLTATDKQKALMASDATYVVDSDMFEENQFPYLEVRRPFILGTRDELWKATASHKFLELLHAHGKLSRLFTQNIDGLDYQTAIPRDKICPVHGTIRQVACEACGTPMDFDRFCDELQAGVKDIYGMDPSAPKASANIFCDFCGKPAMKPTTVLFGSSLPRSFFDFAATDLPNADLVIVAGTSLVVSPANSVAYGVPETTRRLIVNREPVGTDLGISYDDAGRDYFAKGDCDDVFRHLADLLGWSAEMQTTTMGDSTASDGDDTGAAVKHADVEQQQGRQEDS